ncbi:MAG: TetR family transcriptional regulator [Victivallales bacterium]|nr:TetR family transcriptional regulator [Victivallales bacterium]
MAKEEKTAVKERLLATGVKLFAEKGYAASTFRDICEAAGSNIAAINYYFGDKEGFYLAVRDYANNMFRSRLDELWAKAEQDPWEALRLDIDFLLESAYDDTMFQINWMHLRELIDIDVIPKPVMTEERQKRANDYTEKMATFLGKLLGPGADTPENISLLKYTYHSFCLFLPIHRQIQEKCLHGKGRFDVRSAMDKKQLAECIFNVVRHTVDDMRAQSSKNDSGK